MQGEKKNRLNSIKFDYFIKQIKIKKIGSYIAYEYEYIP